MTILEGQPEAEEVEESFEELAVQILTGYDGQTTGQREVSAQQITFYVEQVQPRLRHAEYLAFMALEHSNIVLGQE